MSEKEVGEIKRHTFPFTRKLKETFLALSAQINPETWHLNKVQGYAPKKSRLNLPAIIGPISRTPRRRRGSPLMSLTLTDRRLR